MIQSGAGSLYLVENAVKAPITEPGAFRCRAQGHGGFLNGIIATLSQYKRQTVVLLKPPQNVKVINCFCSVTIYLDYCNVWGGTDLSLLIYLAHLD